MCINGRLYGHILQYTCLFLKKTDICGKIHAVVVGGVCMTKNQQKICMIGAFVLIFIVFAIVLFSGCGKDAGDSKESKTSQSATEKANKMPETYQIEGVPVLKQQAPLNAGCETYACTMLLQSLGIDMDEFEFAESYLNTQPIGGYGEEWYGPDMDSAYAGEIGWGYGINAPAMAKCMNNMLKDKGSEMTATPIKGVELDELCKKYIINDIPVMVWATTSMQEPYVKRYWTVNYVDPEVSDAQIGDTESWLQNEHCMVLIGYDKDNYYFADSVEGKVSVFEKETSRDKYKKLDMQAIVVQ